MATHTSEHNGLIAALVVFVLLFIGAGVAAYYFYDQSDRFRLDADSSKKAAQEARAKELQAIKNYEELRGSVYATQTSEDHLAVMKLIADREKGTGDLLQPRVGARKDKKTEYKNFKDALDFLQDELAAADKRIAEQAEQIASLQKDIESLQGKYQIQVDEVTKDRDAKAKELVEQVEKMKVTIAQAETDRSNIEKQYRDTLNKYQDVKQLAEQEKQVFESKLRKDQQIIDDLTFDQEVRGQIEFVKSDGQVTELTRSEGNLVAYINLGSEDGLLKQTTFGIYGRDKGGNPYKMPKAAMEVIRILGPHSAMARVEGTSNTDPVLVGDLLYNPSWDPGDKLSIGMVGLVYMDDDNEPDNEEFINLIRSLGADVDAFFDIKDLKTKGKIGVNTDWLVIGEVPEDSDNSPQELKDLVKQLRGANTQLRIQARENGVRVVNVRNFLTFMGKQQPQRTVPGGDERYFLFGKKRPALVDPAPQPAVKAKTKEEGK